MNVTLGGRYMPPNPLFNHPMWGAVLRALTPPPAAPVLPRSAADIGGDTWGGPGLNLGPSAGMGGYRAGGGYVPPAHSMLPSFDWSHQPSMDPGFNAAVPPGLIATLRALAGHSGVVHY